MLAMDRPTEVALAEILVNADIHADMRAELKILARSLAPPSPRRVVAATSPMGESDVPMVMDDDVSEPTGTSDPDTDPELADDIEPAEPEAGTDPAADEQQILPTTSAVAVAEGTPHVSGSMDAANSLEALVSDRHRMLVPDVRRRPRHRPGSRSIQPLSYSSDAVGSGSMPGAHADAWTAIGSDATGSIPKSTSSDQLMRHSAQGLTQGESPTSRERAGQRALDGIGLHYLQQHTQAADGDPLRMRSNEPSRAQTPVTPMTPSPMMADADADADATIETFFRLDPLAFEDEDPMHAARRDRKEHRIIADAKKESRLVFSASEGSATTAAPTPARSRDDSDVGVRAVLPEPGRGGSSGSSTPRSRTLKPPKKKEQTMFTRGRSQTLANVQTSFDQTTRDMSDPVVLTAADRRASMDRLTRPLTRAKPATAASSSAANTTEEDHKGSTHPVSFLFHYMHHYPYFAGRAILLKGGDDDLEDLARTVRVLDRIPAYVALSRSHFALVHTPDCWSLIFRHDSPWWQCLL
jgi:hypothetical protein